MGYATLRVERRGPVGWLTFDRPDRGNAMDATMLAELERAWTELDADRDVRVLAVTGAGEAFQTGLDVVQLSRDPEALREQSRRTKRSDLRLSSWHNRVRKPVIAAVNGVCAGGGLHIVADADVVVAAEGAAFLDPHVSVGQVTASEAIALVRMSAMEATMRMALVGRHGRMTATRAHQLGIVGQVVPGDVLVDTVQALGETIARNSPTALAVTKRALWGALEAGLTDACRAGARELVSMWGHPDQTEGPAAFAERRDPVWTPLADDITGPGPATFTAPPPAPPSTPPEEDHMTTAPPGSYSSYETLVIERRGPVGWLIFDRPEQLNAMDATMRDELAVAWREFDADPEVRVIVHTGNGRAFQTGVDVREIATDGVGMERYRRSVEDFDLHFTAWHQGVSKPVITAVNGICAGGGFHWVADADIVMAASDAQFFDPHASIGQVVSLEAIGLIRKVPAEAVMRMAFVGRHERMSARRAHEIGMVGEVVDPPSRLRDAAQELAETIARNSPAALAATKRALWGALEEGLTDACRSGARELVSLWGHPDQTEGPAAFAERREPVWQPPASPERSADAAAGAQDPHVRPAPAPAPAAADGRT
ncbi:MAG TPA: enoyl-CoA hydratase/isomerase family protein [Acidimicrobiales bacterium]|nr:enoyl-CoA hydratase/isomerase family protein [Acidimicrobiales bacterium]